MRIFIFLLLFMGVSFASSPPRILNNSDARLYKEIFALQEVEKNKQADKLIRQLDDKVLLGYVQFQRYMHAGKYRAKFSEMKLWMEAYGDHIGARRVYNLARKRNPGGHRNPQPPRDTFIPEDLQNDSYGKDIVSAYSGTERRMLRQVRVYVHGGNVTVAWNYVRSLGKKIGVDATAAALGHIARGYYHYGVYGKAVHAAEEAMTLAGENEPTAISSWWGGLSAWRLGDYYTSAHLFSHVAVSEKGDKWLRAGGAFWAARSYDKLGDRALADNFRRRALSSSPYSFYGLLSAELLGDLNKLEGYFDWDSLPKPKLNPSQLLKIPAVRQALALNEVGQGDRAETILKPVIKRLHEDANVALLQWLVPLQMGYSSYTVADILSKTTDKIWFSAYYPSPDWLNEAINKNKLIDRAVIMGIVRQESAFQRRARSSAEARGVMQLIPATANFVNGKPIPKNRRSILYKPDENVRLGQKYISRLLKKSNIKNNLLLMAIAYNAGPGNLSKWRKKMKMEQDPLLFIESLPWLETRLYAERVIANIWMYRLRLGQKDSTLSSLARNQQPIYESQD